MNAPTNLDEALRLVSLTKRIMEEQGMRKIDAFLATTSVKTEARTNQCLPSLVAPKKEQPDGFEWNWKRVG